VRPPGPRRPVHFEFTTTVEVDAAPSETADGAAPPRGLPAFTFSEPEEGRFAHFRTRDGPLVRPMAEVYRRFFESENRRIEPGGLAVTRRPAVVAASARTGRLLAPIARATVGEAQGGQVTVRFL
jgi:hypothetical protein